MTSPIYHGNKIISISNRIVKNSLHSSASEIDEISLDIHSEFREVGVIELLPAYGTVRIDALVAFILLGNPHANAVSISAVAPAVSVLALASTVTSANAVSISAVAPAVSAQVLMPSVIKQGLKWSLNWPLVWN